MPVVTQLLSGTSRGPTQSFLAAKPMNLPRQLAILTLSRRPLLFDKQQLCSVHKGSLPTSLLPRLSHMPLCLPQGQNALLWGPKTLLLPCQHLALGTPPQGSLLAHNGLTVPCALCPHRTHNTGDFCMPMPSPRPGKYHTHLCPRHTCYVWIETEGKERGEESSAWALSQTSGVCTHWLRPRTSPQYPAPDL